MPEMTVRSATPRDAAAWEAMRQALWPDESNDHAREIAAFFRGGATMPLAVLLAVDSDSRPIGFVELSIRPYAEGCDTSRVAFLEGWYVAPEWRGRGVGAALIAASEDWARAQGCSEFGSDSLLENDAAHAAHRAVGFEEVERIVCFRKSLTR
jgi:aminoglycoside 6'-N-acetyltransferase I